MAKKIDWKEVWKKFNRWFNRSGCYDWDEQQIKIQQLVEEQLTK